jgi:hypothetical protein
MAGLRSASDSIKIVLDRRDQEEAVESGRKVVDNRRRYS